MTENSPELRACVSARAGAVNFGVVIMHGFYLRGNRSDAVGLKVEGPSAQVAKLSHPSSSTYEGRSPTYVTETTSAGMGDAYS